MAIVLLQPGNPDIFSNLVEDASRIGDSVNQISGGDGSATVSQIGDNRDAKCDDWFV